MCGYSLENKLARPALQGENLMTCQFSGSTTSGFCDAINPEMAVCISAGTEIAFLAPIRFTGFWRIGLHSQHYGAKLARFREVTLDRGGRHRDALELENGGIILLNELEARQTVTILQIPPSGQLFRRQRLPKIREMNFSIIHK